MKAFLDNFSAILGAATISLLLMSVSHEYGYFLIIGRHFQTLLTTYDYFSNAVLWLPVTLVIIYFSLDWVVMFGKSRDISIGLNWRSIIIIVAMIIIPIATSFFLPVQSPYVFLCSFVYFWLTYWTRLLPFADADSDVLRLARRSLIVLPVIMAFLFGYGISHGQSDLESFAEPYTIELRENQRLHTILLRTFDKGVLVRDALQNRIEFVKFDNVVKISRLAVPGRKPLSCSWFRVNCPDAPPTP